jgi:hypothetical protein
MTIQLGRRAAICRALGLGAAVVGPSWLVSGCGSKELTCSDVTELSGEDMKSRSTNEYVDKSADPAKMCAGCKLFKPAGENQCGGCTLVKGPINPKGVCKSWAPL